MFSEYCNEKQKDHSNTEIVVDDNLIDKQLQIDLENENKVYRETIKELEFKNRQQELQNQKMNLEINQKNKELQKVNNEQNQKIYEYKTKMYIIIIYCYILSL